MAKKFLVFMMLFSLALSMMATQEVSALTNSQGQYHRTMTASHHLSNICGDRMCYPGENFKWLSAVFASQRQGYEKAAGGFNGIVIMHQLFVNSQTKSNHWNSITPSHAMGEIPSPMVNPNSPMVNATSSMGAMPSPMVNATSPMVNATSPMVNATSPMVNATGSK